MTTLSLRKANALQVSINDALKGLDLSTTVSLNEFQEPSKVLKEAVVKFEAAAYSRLQFQSSLYNIRKLVAKANAASGINDVLADLAQEEKNIVFYTTLTKAGVQTDVTVITGKLDKARARVEDAYSYRSNDVTTSILTEENIQSYKGLLQDAKKNKVKLQDKLLELNVKTTITLPAVDEAFLSDQNLL